MTTLAPRAKAILDRAQQRANDPAFSRDIDAARADGATWDEAIRRTIREWEGRSEAPAVPAPTRHKVVCRWPDGTEAASGGIYRDPANAESKARSMQQQFPGWDSIVERVR